MMDSVDYSLEVADQVIGLKQPYEHGFFTGQFEAEERFLKAAQTGRLHHAWLLSGPSGVGKATFAFRVARQFVGQSENVQSLTSEHFNEAANPDNANFRKIAKGAHPNLLHLRVPYDEKTKKFKTQLTVDEIRKTTSFFGTTAGDEGWRVAIVDDANAMNLSAANALLKILEEPPARTVFFIVSEQPSRLLPTIRSRCQKLEFQPLDEASLSAALQNASDQRPSEEELKRFHPFVSGSVRKAHQFISNGALELYNEFQALMDSLPQYDVAALHHFADSLSGRNAGENYGFFIEFLESYLAEKVRVDAPARQLVSWACLWEKVQKRLQDEERLNLDRKQTILTLIYDLCDESL